MSLDPIVDYDPERNRTSYRCPHDNATLFRIRGQYGTVWVCPRPPHGPGCGYIVGGNVASQVKREAKAERKRIAGELEATRPSLEDFAEAIGQERFLDLTRRVVAHLNASPQQ
jgi:hypothetical protein